MYFARAKCGIEGGAMVTGSHNPPEFNGLKLLMVQILYMEMVFKKSVK